MELKNIFDSWAKNVKGRYAQKQWLLSKWEVVEGVEWPKPKVDKMVRDICRSLKITKKDSLIELGCGGGWILESLRPRVKKIYGLDISYHMLMNAKGLRKQGILVCGELGHLPFPSNAWPHILSYFVFLNIRDDQYIRQSIREILRVLKKGGRALIGQMSDKDGSQGYDQAKADYVAYCRKVYKLGKNNREQNLLPIKLFDRKEIVRWLKTLDVRFRIQDSFNPFYRPGAPLKVDWRFDIILEK